jgi:hypothetical protein
VGVAQISRAATATVSATVTARDGNKFIAQIMFLAIKSPKTGKSAIKIFHFSHHETNASLIFHMWQVKKVPKVRKARTFFSINSLV